MSSMDPLPCKRCGGMGEEYRIDLDSYSDGPWAPCIGCHGYGIEQSEESLRHCAAVLAAYWRDGWPTCYRADVEVHDMEALCDRSPDLPFAWITRETGSTLILLEHCFPSTAELGGGWWKSPVQFISDLTREGTHRFYWWNGSTLKQHTGEELAHLLSIEIERVQRVRDRRRAA